MRASASRITPSQLHDDGSLEAGKVGVVAGPALAAVSSVDVTMRGVGSHGARPEASKDPIVLSAEYILAIQTIVSRQIPPQDPAVVTVGAIHGGTKRNIIPDEVKMNLTIRSFSDPVQKQILADLKRTADGIAMAGGVPADRMPMVTVMAENSPVTYNNPELADRLRAVCVRTVGAGNVVKTRPEMVSEDFGQFGLEGHQIPTVMLRLGAVAPEKVAESNATGKPLPSLHSAYFISRSRANHPYRCPRHDRLGTRSYGQIVGVPLHRLRVHSKSGNFCAQTLKLLDS